MNITVTKELKGRFVYLGMSYLIVVLIGLVRREDIVYELNRLVNKGGDLYNINVLEGLEIVIRMIGVIGIICVVPVLWIELYSFINTGLNREEKVEVMIGIVVSYILMTLGIYFGLEKVIPRIIDFMDGFRSELDMGYIGMLRGYYSFVEEVMIMMILLTQMPVVCMIMSKTGIVDENSLIRYRRWFYVGGLLVSGIVSPPDIWSQIVTFVPIGCVYELWIMTLFWVGCTRL